MPSFLKFSALNLPWIQHVFTQRFDVPVDQVNIALEQFTSTLGFSSDPMARAEQVHGNRVALVSSCSEGLYFQGADALVTREPGITLQVRTADCGPVFIVDPEHQAIGLVHSGRRGTEGNIVGVTLDKMKEVFGSRPENLIVQLGPCIRPPHYEVDFADTIRQQAFAAGVRSYFDCGICTACHLDTYYSYRAEHGHTGRMWALLKICNPSQTAEA